MNRRLLVLFTLWLGLAAIGHAQLQPLVSNVQASQRTGTKLVDITYLVADGACVFGKIAVSSSVKLFC